MSKMSILGKLASLTGGRTDKNKSSKERLVDRLTSAMETEINLSTEMPEAYSKAMKLVKKAYALDVEWEKQFIDSSVKQEIKEYIVNKMGDRLSSECNQILTEYGVNASIKYTPDFMKTGLMIISKSETFSKMSGTYDRNEVKTVSADVTSSARTVTVVGLGERIDINLDADFNMAVIHCVRNTAESLVAMLWVMIGTIKSENHSNIRAELNKLNKEAWGIKKTVEYEYSNNGAVVRKDISSMGDEMTSILSEMCCIRLSHVVLGI